MTNKAAFPRLVCLLGALLASAASAADLTLYANDDYQGRALSVVIDERNLGVLNFDGRASSLVVDKGTWVLCSDEDYGGRCLTLGPGRYASLQALGLNDEITSVRRRDVVSIGEFTGADTIARAAASSATDIVLYASDNYAGTSHSVDLQQADLPRETLQGMAASVVIADGDWELCGDTYFRGQCVTLGPGKYPTLKDYGLMRGASSVRRAPGSPHR
jgi:Beta/Gamma crystallin